MEPIQTNLHPLVLKLIVINECNKFPVELAVEHLETFELFIMEIM